MAMNCPVQKLAAVVDQGCTTQYDRFLSTGRVFFNVNDNLDYFDFFLNNGTCVAAETALITDFEAPNARWRASDANGGQRFFWPMTRSDCILNTAAIEQRKAANALALDDLVSLKDAVMAYHGKSSATKLGSLLYSLDILSGVPSPTGSRDPFVTISSTACADPAGLGPNLFGAYYQL
jgi:hypothetical protein